MPVSVSFLKMSSLTEVLPLKLDFQILYFDQNFSYLILKSTNLRRKFIPIQKM